MLTRGNVNAKDYTSEQIEVWATGADNIQRWKNAIIEQYFIAAEIQNNAPLLQSFIQSRLGGTAP